MNDLLFSKYKRFDIQPKEVESLVSHCEISTTYKKGETIVREGQICNHIYFIKSGLIKITKRTTKREFITHFFGEGSFFSAVDSFTLQRPAVFEIYALEDCDVLAITYQKYELLCKTDINFVNTARKICQLILSGVISRLDNMLTHEAVERYAIFLKENAHLVNRVSLGDVANYLGITIESLSRIRAKK